MARVRPLIVARNLSGRVVPDADVFIYERDDTEVVADHAKVEIDCYSTEAGGTILGQPLATDARGITAEFWIEPTSYDRRIRSVLDDFILHDEALSARDMGGRELAYTEITSNFVAPDSKYTNTGNVVTGLEIVVPAGDHAVLIEVWAPKLATGSPSGSPSVVAIYEALPSETALEIARGEWHSGVSQAHVPLVRKRRAAAAVDRTYTVRVGPLNAATSTIVTLYASDGLSNNLPAAFMSATAR